MFERVKAAWQVIRSPLPIGTKATVITEIFGGLLKGIESNMLFDYRSYLEAGSKRCWALFKCVDLTAKAAMDTPFRIQKKGGDGSPVVNKELDALFTNPNPFMNMVELIYLTVAHMDLTGNAFWLKDEVNGNNERPRALYPLNPKRMKIVVDQGKGIVGYLYRVEGPASEMPLEVGEVVHHKIPHVNNDYWGLGVVEAGEDLFQEFINRNAWQSRFWKNGAAPSGVLVCEEQVTTPGKWEEAKEKWQKEYGGSNNSGKTAWLNGKWNFLKLGLTNAEMQAIESDRWTTEKIAMQCGVPLSVLGLDSSANYATARTDELRFRRYTVKPMLTFVQKTINSDVIDGFNAQLELIFDISGLVDLDNLRENFTPLFDRGCVSINEMRKMAGLEPDPDNELWNQHFINAGLVPLELSGVADLGQTEQQAQAAVRRFVESTIANQSKGIETALLKLADITAGHHKLLADMSVRVALLPPANGQPAGVAGDRNGHNGPPGA